MNIWKIIILVVIGILVLAGISYGAYYLWPKDETANWQVYKNDKYGFEIKYPINWYPHSNQNPKGISVLLLKSEKLPNIEGTEGSAYGDQIIMGASDLIGPWDKKLSKEEYIQQYYSSEENGPIVKKWVTVNELEMLRVEQMGAGVAYHVLSYLHFKNDKVYSFYLYPYEPTNPNHPNGAQNYKDFLGLVSTFKFTK